MTNNELIQALRKQATTYTIHPMQDLLIAAADRLEELDKRIAIMAADMDKQWGKEY